MTQESWEARYRAHPGVFAGAPHPWVVECAASIPTGLPVLCLADGEGRNSRWLAGLGHEVVAVEWSPAAVARARSDAPAVTHVCADAREWARTQAARGPWGAVVAVYAPLGDGGETAGLLSGRLAPDGVLIAVGSPAVENLREAWPLPVVRHESNGERELLLAQQSAQRPCSSRS